MKIVFLATLVSLCVPINSNDKVRQYKPTEQNQTSHR